MTTAILLSILISTGASHCTVRSSVSGPSSSRVTEQVREKVSPAVGVPVEEIVTLGRGAEEWMKYAKERFTNVISYRSIVRLKLSNIAS